MNTVIADKKNLEGKIENANQPFAQIITQTENKGKTTFMQDFENGETIEQSQDFVLKHIDKLWKK
jgi:spore cortex formation protein SpoVR/YcgB (stage V sporulation)